MLKKIGCQTCENQNSCNVAAAAAAAAVVFKTLLKRTGSKPQKRIIFILVHKHFSTETFY